MGNCIQKPKRKKINNPNEVVNIPPMSPLMDIPTDPSKDPFGKYLWINVHTSSINFLNKQKEGYIVCMTEDTGVGNKWFRKINSDKSFSTSNPPYPIISGIIMEHYSNDSNNIDNNIDNNNNNNNNSNNYSYNINNNNSNNYSYNSDDWPSPPTSLPS